MTDAEHGQLELLPSVPTAEQIKRLEDNMLGMAQLPIWASHHFAEGLYAREITIPADTTLTGAEHSCEHLNICIGDITVWTEDGMKRLTGIHVIRSLPGAKRVGYTHAETRWITVHANPRNEADIARLEAMLVPNQRLLERVKE